MPENKFFGGQLWFAIHRPLMFSVTLISVAAFLIILADLDWNWVELSDPLSFAHSITGIATIFLSIIQVIFTLNDLTTANSQIKDHGHLTEN